MPRAVFLLLRGSTPVIPRSIWTSSTPYLLKTTPITASLIATKSSIAPRQNIGSPISKLNCNRLGERIDFSLLSARGIGTLFSSRGDTPIFSCTARGYCSQDLKKQVWAAIKMKKVIVIGISGITNGGKTTLCERLEKDLPMATHINMDDYFFPADNVPLVPELNHGNYEETSQDEESSEQNVFLDVNCSDVKAIDFETMTKDVDKWVMNARDQPIEGQPQILFLEGILIFNYPPLVKYYSRKYFLTLTKEQCWERRKHRSYNPPDPPNYYDLVVWPMYLKNKSDIQDQKDIVYLDGMESSDKTYKRILGDIKTLMEG